MDGYRLRALGVSLLLAVVGPATAQDGPATAPPKLPFPAAGAQCETTAPSCLGPTCLERLATRCPGDPLHWWASAEYAFGWLNGASAPPLLTATPVVTSQPSVLFGDRNLNGDVRNGFQLRGGFWLDECGTCGIDAGMLYLSGAAHRARVGDTPGTVIARPFTNALTNLPDAELVSVPGALSGRATIDAVSSDFWGADVALRKLICCDCRGRLDCLVGYRFLSYGDSVRVAEDLHPLVAPFPPGTRITVADSFTAENRFHGALFALAGEYRRGGWYVQGRGGFSVGGSIRRATITGATSIQVPPAPPTALPGGLLALSSNSGSYSSSDCVIVPEASVRVGRQVTQHLRVYVGYTFLYWPSVYRAADQIDPVINPGLLPPPVVPLTGPVRPLFPDRLSSLRLHALSVGLELRY
jgi:hypothetical protein